MMIKWVVEEVVVSMAIFGVLFDILRSCGTYQTTLRMVARGAVYLWASDGDLHFGAEDLGDPE